MFHRWAALTLVLALCAISPRSAAGQRSSPVRGRPLGSLGQNYPNPFKAETYIPFTVEDCGGVGGQHSASMRIYNVLAQLVAVPVLFGADRPLTGLRLSCGEYLGVWNGRLGRRGQRAAPGVYVYELIVDGQRLSRKLFLTR